MQTFTISKAASAADITVGTLNGWITRGLLEFGDDPGKGRARRFTFADVVQFRVLHEMTRRGMTASAAAAAIRKFRRGISAYIQGNAWLRSEGIVLDFSDQDREVTKEQHRFIVISWYVSDGKEVMNEEIVPYTDLQQKIGMDDTFGATKSAILLNLTMITQETRKRLFGAERVLSEIALP